MGDTDRENTETEPINPGDESADPSSTNLALAYHYLGGSISDQRAAASFVCGGSFPVVSSPVRVFWAKQDNVHEANQLALPLDSTSKKDSSIEMLDHLVADCEPASFGRGQEDVIDVDYRKAGKLDPDRFVSNFCPADFGIINIVEQILLPNFNTQLENLLPFRRLKAELYKLNVYSGPSGLFKKHVDTPRSRTQIGSLVVCLPSSFSGGKLAVRHEGKEVDFDWEPQSASTIQWAAFYSDCEHEIMTITEGARLTLTYNLFATEVEEGSIARPIMDPTKLPLWEDLKKLFSEPVFMKDGGVLGIYCSHAYPHATDIAEHLLPRGLKGADLALFSVLKSFGLGVVVRPVLQKKDDPYHDPDDDYPADDNPGDNNPDDGRSEVKGELVGNAMHGFHTTDQGPEQGDLTDMDKIAGYVWPAQRLSGVTWIGFPQHQELAFSYLAQGNEPTIELTYSVAAIMVDIPPFNQRGNIIS